MSWKCGLPMMRQSRWGWERCRYVVSPALDLKPRTWAIRLARRSVLGCQSRSSNCWCWENSCRVTNRLATRHARPAAEKMVVSTTNW